MSPPSSGRLERGAGLPTSVPVVIAASAPWETPAPVNAHQVARRLAARGHAVLFAESTGLRAPTLGSGHDWRRIVSRVRGFAAGVREVAPRLHVVSPLAPPQAGPPELRRVALSLMGGQVARAARRLGLREPVLWAFLPTACDWRATLRARLVVYHCVDHYAANPGADRAWIDALEERMLQRADLVFATSEVLAARLRPRARRLALVPNVADVELFARALEAVPEPEALAGLPRPRAVYLGNLAAYRVDFTWLHAVADAGVALVLVGAVGLGDVEALPPEARRLLERPEVRALGPLPPDALPAVLAHVDVGLVPFVRNEHTLGSLPLKLWEYVAAGLPVVASDLPNLAAASREADVRLAGDARSFAARVREAAAEPASLRPARSRCAAGHDWGTRMDALCAEVADALGAHGAGALEGGGGEVGFP